VASDVNGVNGDQQQQTDDESYSVYFVFCSDITSVFHVPVPVFQFKLGTMILQRRLTTLVQLFHGRMTFA